MGADDVAWRRREELSRLTAEQVVGVRTAAGFHGSGFLVSEDTVLTCAHVVQGREGLSVTVQGRTTEVDLIRLVPGGRGTGSIYGFPDLAELRLRQSLPGIGVWLGEKGPPQGGEVAAHGFSGHTLEGGVQPDTLHLVVAGASGQFVRVHWDRVVQGFSGGPVLDLRTGRVCGVLKASRDEQDAQGGWLIPIDAVRSHFPELAARNDRAHRPGTVWCDMALERCRRQTKLFGLFGRDRRRRTASRVTPAQLLAHGTMPFVERPELADLQAWCVEEPDQLLRLLHAPGGSGKTRLAAELCRWANDQGWIAGFADKGDPGQPQWLAELTDALAVGIPVLVVFDYAQARLDDICVLLEHVYQHGPERMRLRLLLLARSDEPLWQALQRRVDDWALADASVVQLPRTIAVTGNTSLASTAFTVFADRLGCGWLAAPQSLDARAEKEDSLLGVLALALDAVLTLEQGGTWSEADDPLDRICDHEIRGWHALLAARLPKETVLSGESGERLSEGLLLVPTLAPGRQPTDLRALLDRVHSAAFPGQQALNMFGVHTCLQMLYPAGDDRVAPLEPDRIGEILIRRVLSTPESSGHTNAYLDALLDARHLTSEEARITAAAETVEVLARARGCTSVGRVEAHAAHPALDSALGQAVAEHPDVMLPALAISGSALPHAEPLAAVMIPVLEVCEPSFLTSVESRLPDYPSSMSPVSVVVLGRLLDLRSEEFTEGDQLLRLRRLTRYSLRLDDIGRNDTALETARQSVALSRDLVQQSGRHMAEYAAALNNLSLLLHRAGQTVPALEQSRSAVALYEQLLAGVEEEDVQRQRYLLDTAAALSTLALLRLEDGQVHAAADEAARGVLLCEEARPGARQDDTLLTCVEILAECRQRAGLIAAAVVSGAESVALLRELAERQPGRYLARLAEGLHSHARGLIRAGQDREAYLAMREAVNLRKALPGGDPTRLAAQRRSLCALTELCDELNEFAHQRDSWLEQLESLGDHGE
ncbi:trypsin-like peptidase domain-containing protein [Streptomyces sp. NPDC051956]|uniref:trypsin-like peptidase domain-containing protein n=1 Tax=Streptomyces sp. NPDC051956 TaxID=3365677 RepID=UPI0037D49C92